MNYNGPKIKYVIPAMLKLDENKSVASDILSNGSSIDDFNDYK